MAQRYRRPPRIGAGLPTFGSRRISRLHSGFSQAEEARPGPMRAGDPPGYLSQRLVSLAFVFEAVIKHDNGVRLSSSFAQQPRAGLEQKNRGKRLGSVRLEFIGKRTQPPLDRGSEPAIGPLLHLVGDLAEHQIAARPCRRIAAAQTAPRDPQLLCRQYRQPGDFAVEGAHSQPAAVSRYRVTPASSFARISSLPSLRRPVRAARTLCTCHPVASVKSLIAAPSGRSSRPRMAAFFDWRIR